jgi:hypothetical protein
MKALASPVMLTESPTGTPTVAVPTEAPTPPVMLTAPPNKPATSSPIPTKPPTPPVTLTETPTKSSTSSPSVAVLMTAPTLTVLPPTECILVDVDFSEDAQGNKIPAGAYVKSEWAEYGLSLSAANRFGTLPCVFDMANPGESNNEAVTRRLFSCVLLYYSRGTVYHRRLFFAGR